MDGGTHFYNKLVDKVLQKYGVRHRTSLSYHSHANGQAEVSNREIKSIMEKIVNSLRKYLSKRLKMHFEHIGQHLKPHWVCRNLD